MWWLFQVLLSALFLLSIVLSVPIAFDVGGRDSGLAYSLALFYYYLGYSTIRAATSDTRAGRTISAVLRLSQWVIIPALLIWALDRFAVDAGGATWVERTFEQFVQQKPATWSEWVNGVVETVTLGGWDKTLRYSIPVFQLLEGFCTLLVIQAAGQMTKWLINQGRSDTWMIVLLALSGSIIASAVYFLWRVAQFPHISNIDATLIGITMTTAFFLCTFGITSGKGNPVESSLLFAYVVLCVYQIFTDYLPSDGLAEHTNSADSQPEFPPLPPIIMASYSTFLHMLGSLPSAVHSAFSLFYAAFQTTTASVIISLLYRIIVFYFATRIIPAVREYGAQAIIEDSPLEDSEGANKLLELLSWFAPSILIAIYTSLLLQHFTVSDGPDGWTLRGGDAAGGNLWRWVNVAATMALYTLELYLGNDETNHWKVD